LVNLLANAVKFTAVGRVVVDVEVTGERVRFAVRDTGVGIEPDAAGRLFDAFTQADLSTTREFGGTGLGLAIVRQISALHGGEVGAEGELGVGSTFWFSARLPPVVGPAARPLAGRAVRVEEPDPDRRRRLEALVARAGGVRGAEVVLATAGPVPRGGMVVGADARASVVLERLAGESGPLEQAVRPALTGRVLVAEDNPVNQLVARAVLEGIGMEVEIVGDGQQAVAAALAGSFDVVLMDCQMPVMDGLSATRQLRAAGYAVPIVALTASATAQDERACLEAGMDGYLAKPYRQDELSAALLAVLPQPGTG
jgi:CheY-like chemotaxis protein